MKFGSVEMDFLITNPTDQVQTVKFSSPLPEEIRPEHIADLGDFNLEYDVSLDEYYIHNNIKLAPNESVVKKIVMNDIWTIEKEKIDLFKMRLQELSHLFDKSEDENLTLITSLKKNINSILEKILNNQKESLVTPQTHIAAFRMNKSLLEVAEEKLNELNQAAIQIKSIGLMTYQNDESNNIYFGAITFAFGLGFILMIAIIFKMWQNQIQVMVSLKENKKILKKLK